MVNKVRKGEILYCGEQIRPMVLVDTLINGRIYTSIFYKSTGVNSGKKDKWFPILGVFNHTFLENEQISLITNLLYEIETLKKTKNERWFIKFANRMGANDKYNKILEEMAYFIQMNEESLKERFFRFEKRRSRYVISELNKSNEHSYELWLVANMSEKHPQYSQYDCFPEL